MKIFHCLILAGILILEMISCPISANLNKISPGDIVFLGENGLDLTDITNIPTQIAWYAPCTEVDSSFFREDTNNDVSSNDIPPPTGYFSSGYCDKNREPDHILDIPEPENFFVSPDLFIGHAGDFFLWDGSQKGELAFKVREPYLALKVYDTTTKRIITDEPIPRGHIVNFIINTNLGAVFNRNGYTDDEAPINLMIEGPRNSIFRGEVSGLDTASLSLHNLPVDETDGDKKWYWVGVGTDHSNPSKTDGWNTGALFSDCDFVYNLGEYSVWAESHLNDMMDYYTTYDGTTYAGKTVSGVKKFNLVKGDESDYNQCITRKDEQQAKFRKLSEWTGEGIPPPTGTTN